MNSQTTLAVLRNQIDAIDSELCVLIGKRMAVSRQMKELKNAITDIQREKTVKAQWLQQAEQQGISETCACAILYALFAESKRQQIGTDLHCRELFDIWNEVKKEAHHARRLDFQERDIWFVRLGHNIGSEQNGKGNDFLRPVVVVKKYNRDVFLAVPLTRTTKKGPYYFPFQFHNQRSNAVLSQIRLLDARRLHHKMGKMPLDEFGAMRKATSLFLS